MHVAKMTDKDLPDVLVMGTAMHKEGKYNKYPFSPEQLLRGMRDALRDPDWGCFVAKDGDDDYIGFITGYVATLPFSTVRLAYEYGMYLQPTHRRGLNALGLLRVFENWARRRGVADIVFGNSLGVVDDERATAFFTRIGYRPHGTTYIKEAH